MDNTNVSSNTEKALEGEKEVFKVPYQPNLLFNFFSGHTHKCDPKEDRLVF